MKKIITIITMILSVATFAQSDYSKQRKMKFTAEQQAILQTKQMVLDLDLSDTQQKQLLPINEKQAQLREKIMKEHKALKESKESLSSDEMFKMKEQVLNARIDLQAQMKRLLDNQQFEKWHASSGKQYHRKQSAMKKKQMHQKMKRKEKKPM